MYMIVFALKKVQYNFHLLKSGFSHHDFLLCVRTRIARFDKLVHIYFRRVEVWTCKSIDMWKYGRARVWTSICKGV